MNAAWLAKVRRPSVALALALGILLAWAAAGAASVNWAPLVPPLDQPQMILRNDGKGSGEFGSPRSGHRQHRGVDLAAPLGTAVRAIRSGVVSEAGVHHGLGRYVELQHGGDLRSLYGHLQTVSVQAGQRVRQSQVIGTVGKTGNARNPIIKSHLHVEIIQGETPIDPERFGLTLVRIDSPTDDDEAAGGE